MSLLVRIGCSRIKELFVHSVELLFNFYFITNSANFTVNVFYASSSLSKLWPKCFENEQMEFSAN